MGLVKPWFLICYREGLNHRRTSRIRHLPERTVGRVALLATTYPLAGTGYNRQKTQIKPTDSDRT